jgi:hypothetical protein
MGPKALESTEPLRLSAKCGASRRAELGRNHTRVAASLILSLFALFLCAACLRACGNCSRGKLRRAKRWRCARAVSRRDKAAWREVRTHGAVAQANASAVWQSSGARLYPRSQPRPSQHCGLGGQPCGSCTTDWRACPPVGHPGVSAQLPFSAGVGMSLPGWVSRLILANAEAWVCYPRLGETLKIGLQIWA